VILKYDFYDYNTKAKGQEITVNKELSEGDVRFDTFGVLFLHHFNWNLKAVIY
jgi:hypothetical protein